MGMDMQGHGHVDGRIGVWTQMHCMWMRMSGKEKEKQQQLAFVNVDGEHVGLQMCCMWTWMCCVWMRMSRKERKKEKKTYFGADGWLASGKTLYAIDAID